MIKLPQDQIRFYKGFIKNAEYQAMLATCKRAKCGVVIIKEHKIIGSGFNSPPGNLEAMRTCHLDKRSIDEKVTDKTCCIHAEQRAMDEAISKYGKKEIRGSGIIFARVDDQGNTIHSGQPYCTICSKRAVDLGISYWVLNHQSGIYVYSSEEYHRISLAFKNEEKPQKNRITS
ncbi:MAG: hypothetical protein ABIB79_00695 [archaeon]